MAVSVPEPEHDGDWLAYMRAIRVDLPGAHAYAQALSESLDDWLQDITAA